MNVCAVGKAKIAINIITQVQADKLQVIERESSKETQGKEKLKISIENKEKKIWKKLQGEKQKLSSAGTEGLGLAATLERDFKINLLFI